MPLNPSFNNRDSGFRLRKMIEPKLEKQVSIPDFRFGCTHQRRSVGKTQGNTDFRK